MFLHNSNEQTDVKISGNSIVTAPTNFEFNRFAEIQKKSLTEK